jgi:hypothetical protein
VFAKGNQHVMPDVISQAESLLSKRFSINTADAYALLLRLSDRQHLPLRSTAEQLTHQPGRPHV